jgi:hypothetical protein
MTDLSAFLKRALDSAAPWNCSTLASDWCVANGHPDFATAWRGVIEPDACDAAAADGGGLLALWDRDIGNGLPATDEPARGDIGVIAIAGLLAGAIFTGERWATQGPRTLHFLAPEQVEVLKAWRV